MRFFRRNNSFLLALCFYLFLVPNVEAAGKASVCSQNSYKGLERKLEKFQRSINKYSKHYGVSAALIKAIITVESCFNSKAVSAKGASGLMQLMPATAKRFGTNNRFSPDTNIRGGTRYLAFLQRYFKNDFRKVDAAYNVGEGAVKKYNAIPPYAETRAYVPKIEVLYELYSTKGKNFNSLIKRGNFNLSLPRYLIKTRSKLSPYKRSVSKTRLQRCRKTAGKLRRYTHLRKGKRIQQRVYRVRKGDTLLKIMQKTGINKHKVMQLNKLSSGGRLVQGRNLVLSECHR